MPEIPERSERRGEAYWRLSEGEKKKMVATAGLELRPFSRSAPALYH
jgi:hypothetical protein